MGLASVAPSSTTPNGDSNRRRVIGQGVSFDRFIQAEA